MFVEEAEAVVQAAVPNAVARVRVRPDSTELELGSADLEAFPQDKLNALESSLSNLAQTRGMPEFKGVSVYRMGSSFVATE